MTTTSQSNQQINLRDGRILGYDEHGTAHGKPIIFMHGSPGSRLDWLMFAAEDAAEELNARIISVDRPGMGLSDFKHGNVPGSVGHYVAGAIPNCRATFFEDEGHFTLPVNHMRGILGVLVV